MVSLKSLLGGGLGELGQPDLLREVVDGILKLRRHGDRGFEMLPPEVEVRITVGEGSLQVIQRFVDDPAFDREVGASVLNRLVKSRDDLMPIRRYVVQPGPATRIEVVEAAPHAYTLTIQGGDRDGARFAIPATRKEVLLGRGPWHGDGPQVANDVVLCENERAVSRRAARLHRTGSFFELEALDQREAVAVSQPDGQKRRPALSASGRVPVRPGDVIEFTDGSRPVLSVQLEEVKA
jgi:hypothetical protein